MEAVRVMSWIFVSVMCWDLCMVSRSIRVAEVFAR